MSSQQLKQYLSSAGKRHSETGNACKCSEQFELAFVGNLVS